MLTKNLTEFLFGARVTSRKPPQREMSCVVRAAFRILPDGTLGDLLHPEQGALSADTFGDDDDEAVGECLRASDFADFKLSAEVLFKGSCHTPGGRPLGSCAVKFSVGDWSKSLRVLGPRTWSVTGSPTEPAAFSSMKLSWSNAFGGPGYAKNPVGKGVDGVDVPNVEYPQTPVRGRNDASEPATFGPISPHWPARATMVGEDYGPRWRARRAPFYAEDFDWRYHFSAPADQRLSGYLQGDEEVTLQNLLPGSAVLSFRLPALRIRVFAKGTNAVFREVAMSLDTLFVDGDEGKVYLTWRGLNPVAQDDLSDVATMLIASERLLEAPAPVASYRAQLEAYERDPVELEGKLPSIGLFQGAATADDVDPVSKLLAERGVPEDARVGVRKAIADAQKAKPDLDLSAAVAAATQESPPAFVPIKPGVFPPQGLRGRMRSLLEAVGKARAQLDEHEAQLDRQTQGQELSPELSALRERMVHQAKELDRAEEAARDPRLSQLDPSYSYPTPLSTDEPGPGRNLEEHDLRGRDLRGADLRGANLRAADLSKADLRGANLQGADLKYAILWKANAEGADFSGADLTLVNAIGLSAAGASFEKAKLDLSSFETAVLDDANLQHVSATYVIFTKSSLMRARFTRADLSHAELDQAKLSGADLREIVAKTALFAKANLTGADLSRAMLEGASFTEANCNGASFVDARLTRALFTKASAKDAHFGGAFLTTTTFDHAEAPGASFVCVRAREARFYRAQLGNADFGKADLMNADLRGAMLAKVSFRDASLYDAKLLGAAGDQVDFRGANLTRALLPES
jgi:uncharacterized protein YjbI with pentapeptide repeats